MPAVPMAAGGGYMEKDEAGFCDKDVLKGGLRAFRSSEGRVCKKQARMLTQKRPGGNPSMP